jgi:hypothetical protein
VLHQFLKQELALTQTAAALQQESLLNLKQVLVNGVHEL